MQRGYLRRIRSRSKPVSEKTWQSLMIAPIILISSHSSLPLTTFPPLSYDTRTLSQRRRFKGYAYQIIEYYFR